MPDSAPTRPRSILLYGTGLLAEAITGAAAERNAEVSPEGTGDGAAPVWDALVTADDSWNLDRAAQARPTAARLGVPWLRVRAELNDVVIGPTERTGGPGCGRCAELRRRRIAPDEPERHAVLRAHRERLSTTPSDWLTPVAADVAAHLVLDEMASLVDGTEPRTRTALLRLDLETLALARHTFLPDPLCPVCGGSAAGGDAPRPLTLAASPAYAPGSYRSRDIGAELDRLEALYVDDSTGIVARPRSYVSAGGLVVTAARVGLGAGIEEAGSGRASTFPASRKVALMEALERYGSVPRAAGARGDAVVTAAYADIKGQALDPRELGLHDPQRYTEPDFPYSPFDERTEYSWVWGHSFARGEPVLVPLSYAFYNSSLTGREDPAFVYEISNGCALGGSLAEAVLYGLLEVAERDAFLLTWYARLPAPRIRVADTDSAVALRMAAAEAGTGYRMLLFDTTTELGLPCVWAMAVNPAGGGDDRPAVVCAAGSHPTAAGAAQNALSELVPILGDVTERYRTDPGRARAMAGQPELVTHMEDHALCYADPSAAERLAYLIDSPHTRDLGSIGDSAGFHGDDLRDHARAAVDRCLGAGLDVIVVDQTTPEHELGGLSCVKVIVPGTLPMTFGHRNRRIEGLPRLRTVPRLLGFRDGDLPAAAVNAEPHPFP